MKKIFLFSVFSLIAVISKAQLTYQWANSVGSVASSEYGQAIASDPSGNVYVAGIFSGTVDFDPGPGTANLSGLSGSQDIFLAKYNSAGAFIWVKQIAGTNNELAYDLVADASGAYLAGTFLGTVDFDPNATTNNITSLGGGTDGDGFFAKYDVNGNLLWADRIGSTANDRVTSIAIDASSNVFVTGFIGANADMDPSAASASLNVSGTYNAYIGKYTSAGAYTFAKQITGGYSEGDDINVDASGNIYLTGSYATTNDFDPSAATANLSTSSLTQLDIFLAKYTSAGVYTFAKQIGGTGVDIGFQVLPDASGNIYLGGVFSSTCDFDPTATVNSLTSAGSGDLFVAKYNASGNLSWKTGTGGTGNDYCMGMGIDGAGNVYITGKVQGTNVDFDPSAASALLTSTSNCLYIAAYGSAGNFLSLSTPGNILSEGRGLIVNTSVYVTGMFRNTGDFDFSASTANLTSLGLDDIFYAKYNVCAGSPPAQPSVISGNLNPCNGTANTYSVTNDPLASSYTWTFPLGWTGSSTTNVSVPTVSNSGIISVVATNSCGASLASTISVTAGGFSNAIATATNVSCFGNNNGMASVTYTGGAGPVSLLWQPGLQTTTLATNLAPGIHTVTLLDANSCSISKTVSITQPSMLTLNVSGTNPTCYNSANGSAVANVSGGTPAYTYSWSPAPLTGSNTSAPSGMASGNHVVTITDAKGCIITGTVSLLNPPQLLSSVTLTHVSCNAMCNGKAIASFTNNAGPLSYTWMPASSSTATITNLCAGTYTMMAKDANNCFTALAFTIVQPPVLNSAFIAFNGVSCNGGSNGSATILSSGGVPGYTYSWSPGAQTGSVLTNALAGNYTCTTTDANGCAIYNTINIIQPTPLVITTNSIINVSCFGFANGQIATSITGGTPTYSVTWMPVLPSTQTVSNIAAGTYTMNIMDAQGCTTASVYSISQPPQIFMMVTANGACSNSIASGTVVANGGTPGYTYNWNPSAQTTSIATGLSAGNYTVTVTDLNGCVANTSISVTSILSPTINVASNASLICTGQTATLTANGANTYTWNTTSTAPFIAVSPTVTTTYTVTGSANGCSNTTTFTQIVSTCTGFDNVVNKNFELKIYPNPFENDIKVETNAVTEKDIIIYNSIGEIIYNTKFIEETPILKLEKLPPGIYFMTVVCGDKKQIVKLIKE